MKNFTFLVVKLAGSRAIIASELLEVLAHVERFETDYLYHFLKFQRFGAFFINKNPRGDSEVPSFMRVWAGVKDKSTGNRIQAPSQVDRW